MYEMDLQLRMYVMDEISEECNDLDINMDRVQALTLLAQINQKNEALEMIIQTAKPGATVDQVLQQQGLSIDSVTNAQTANIDLTKYATCEIDATSLENDVAMINDAYKRCKMLTDSAMLALTDTLIVLADARD